jgi:hypothetical protein
MKFDKILNACSEFEKLAQQTKSKIVLDPKKQNVYFWSNFLYNALVSYSDLLRTPQNAKNVFDGIAQYLKAPAYNQGLELKQVEQIATAMQEAEAKLQQAGINPLDALKEAGFTNLNANTLNLLKANLDTLKEAKDFSKYQHYYLPRPGMPDPRSVIELDDTDNGGPGY